MTKELKEKFRESFLLAKVLEGAWRNTPPKFELSIDEVEEISRTLQVNLAMSLAWWRMKETELRETEIARKFQDVHRFYALQNRVKEWRLQESYRLLRAKGIEPIIVKGWAINRLYPDTGLRFYIDNDLMINPAQYEQAKEIINTFKETPLGIDMHKGASNNVTKSLDIEVYEKLFARSILVRLNDETDVRVLCHEDHLRLLITHWLLDGGERASGLCDVALIVEKYASDFDWEVCLTDNKTRRGWITSTIELAHQLLGADVSKVPAIARNEKLPRWLLPAVLRAWTNQKIFTPLSDEITSPVKALEGLKTRWPPNPIYSTARFNGAFTDFPRLPYQIANYANRSLQFFQGGFERIFSKRKIDG